MGYSVLILSCTTLATLQFQNLSCTSKYCDQVPLYSLNLQFQETSESTEASDIIL